jgi:hypothetical protein
MCTLSWTRNQEGYQVFFNRDEQRSRSLAELPQCIDHNGVPVILPLDPDGGGSWISVNGHGLSLCLLNFYQGTVPREKLISRGQLLRSLAHAENINSLNNQILTTDLTHYAPFTLVAFQITPDIRLPHPPPQEQTFQWNGVEIHHSQPENMITSSSVKFDEVSKQRQQFYSQEVPSSSNVEHNNKHNTDKHVSFHASHGEKKNHRSVCMHREDARTVSFSHILVTNNHVEFSYHNGSPCDSSSPTFKNSLPRIR